VLCKEAAGWKQFTHVNLGGVFSLCCWQDVAAVANKKMVVWRDVQVQATLLMHIHTLLKYDAGLGNDWVKQFKTYGPTGNHFILQACYRLCCPGTVGAADQTLCVHVAGHGKACCSTSLQPCLMQIASLDQLTAGVCCGGCDADCTDHDAAAQAGSANAADVQESHHAGALSKVNN